MSPVVGIVCSVQAKAVSALTGANSGQGKHDILTDRPFPRKSTHCKLGSALGFLYRVKQLPEELLEFGREGGGDGGQFAGGEPAEKGGEVG